MKLREAAFSDIFDLYRRAGFAESAAGEGKAKAWYTGFALSDLVVSGGWPYQGNLARHRFSQAPTAYAPKSLPPGGSVSDLKNGLGTIERLSILELDRAEKPGNDGSG
jgi:hypothetical protein